MKSVDDGDAAAKMESNAGGRINLFTSNQKVRLSRSYRQSLDGLHQSLNGFEDIDLTGLEEAAEELDISLGRDSSLLDAVDELQLVLEDGNFSPPEHLRAALANTLAAACMEAETVDHNDEDKMHVVNSCLETLQHRLEGMSSGADSNCPTQNTVPIEPSWLMDEEEEEQYLSTIFSQSGEVPLPVSARIAPCETAHAVLHSEYYSAVWRLPSWWWLGNPRTKDESQFLMRVMALPPDSQMKSDVHEATVSVKRKGVG